MNSALPDDIKYIIEDTVELEPLTTVIGIKCNDGIILASDSQFTADKMKFFGGSKLFKINNFVALGAAGNVSQMTMLADALKQKLGENIFSELERSEERRVGKEYKAEWMQYH